jgi:glutathione S-transferase
LAPHFVLQDVQQKLDVEFELVLVDRKSDAQKSADYLVGDRVGVCDYFLLMLAIWADETEKPALSFTNLKRYLCQLVKLDAVQAVCQKENISLEEYC